MTWVDTVGYLASSLVLITFCMRTMLRLRAVAVCSNIAFVLYAIGDGVYPVLFLHLILLPLNVSLLVRMLWTLRQAKHAAATDLSAGWLQPFMQLRRLNAGEIIFRKGDFAHSLYMISSGEVRLPEIRQSLTAGDVFGEIGLFAVDRIRRRPWRRPILSSSGSIVRNSKSFTSEIPVCPSISCASLPPVSLLTRRALARGRLCTERE